MVKLPKSAVITVLFFVMGISAAFAAEPDEAAAIGHLESLGGGEYMADSGEIIEMEGMGGESKMSSEGDIYQGYGSGGDDLASPGGGLLRVEE